MSKHILLMPFIDGSHSFTNGFECGMLWNEMTDGAEFKNKVVHEANRQQIIMMAEHFGYEYSFKHYDEDWCYLTAKPVNIAALVS